MANFEASPLTEVPQEEPHRESLMIETIKNVEDEARDSVAAVSTWSIVFARDTEQDVMANTLKLLERIEPALTDLMEQVKSKKVINMTPIAEICNRITKQLVWFNHNLGDRIPLWPVKDEWKHLTNEDITEILKQAQDYLKISGELLKDLVQEGNSYNESRKKQNPKRLHSYNNEGDSLPLKQAKRDQTDQQPSSSSSQLSGPSNIMPQIEEFQAADDHLFDDLNALHGHESPEVFENRGSGLSEVPDAEERNSPKVPEYEGRQSSEVPQNEGRDYFEVHEIEGRQSPEVFENEGRQSPVLLQHEGRESPDVPENGRDSPEVPDTEEGMEGEEKETNKALDSEDICFLADAYMKFGLLSREPKDEREKQIIEDQIKILEERSLKEKNVSDRVPYQQDAASTHLKEVLYTLIDKCNTPLQPMNERQPHGTGQKKLKVPHLLFTTNALLDGTYENGQTIVDAAKNSGASGNRVYVDELEFVDKKMKRRFYKHNGFDENFGEKTGRVLPVVTVNPDTPNLEEFQTVAHELSSFVIENATKVFGVKKNAFTREEVIKAVGDQKCDVLIQRSQHSGQNYSINSSIKDKRPGQAVQRSWHQPGGSIKMKKLVKDILGGNHAHRQKFVDQAVEKFMASPKDVDTIMRELREILQTSQVEPEENDNKKMKKPTGFTSAFATNLDFNDLTKHKEQAKMLDKIWDMLKPCHRLFAHCEKIVDGMNGVQVYVKEPGSRTSGHLENQIVASINWNMGPGDCVWIMVPLAYAPKMEELMCKKKIWPYATPYWPSERDLINNGISYQKIIQKTDDLVYVGVGTYHWVQANGPCVNVSWNVAEITSLQLAATALNVDHCAEHQYQIVLPFESILWDLALKNVQPPNDERFWSFAKGFLARSLAKCQFEWSFMESDTNKTGDARHFSELKDLQFECYKQNNTVPMPYCHQKLFNLTVVHNDPRHGLRELCYNCAAKLKSGERTYYYRYTMDQLVSIFDNYRKADQ